MSVVKMVDGYEVKRPEPIPVPDDWLVQGIRARKRITKEDVQKAEALGVMSLDDVDIADRNLKPVPMVADDMYLYFETVINFPKIFEARKRIVNKGWVLKVTIEGEDLEFSREFYGFQDWWITSRYDVDVSGLWDLKGYFAGICAPAFNVYIVTGNIDYAYHVLREQIKSTGFGGGK